MTCAMIIGETVPDTFLHATLFVAWVSGTVSLMPLFFFVFFVSSW